MSLSCTQCGRMFKKEWLWKRHMNSVHNPDAQFACTVNGCPKKFKRKDVRDRHEDNQHGIKKPQCPNCLDFVRKDALEEHKNGPQCRYRTERRHKAALLSPSANSNGHLSQQGSVGRSPVSGASEGTRSPSETAWSFNSSPHAANEMTATRSASNSSTPSSDYGGNHLDLACNSLQYTEWQADINGMDGAMSAAYIATVPAISVESQDSSLETGVELNDWPWCHVPDTRLENDGISFQNTLSEDPAYEAMLSMHEGPSTHSYMVEDHDPPRFDPIHYSDLLPDNVNSGSLIEFNVADPYESFEDWLPQPGHFEDLSNAQFDLDQAQLQLEGAMRAATNLEEKRRRAIEEHRRLKVELGASEENIRRLRSMIRERYELDVWEWGRRNNAGTEQHHPVQHPDEYDALMPESGIFFDTPGVHLPRVHDWDAAKGIENRFPRIEGEPSWSYVLHGTGEQDVGISPPPLLQHERAQDCIDPSSLMTHPASEGSLMAGVPRNAVLYSPWSSDPPALSSYSSIKWIPSVRSSYDSVMLPQTALGESQDGSLEAPHSGSSAGRLPCCFHFLRCLQPFEDLESWDTRHKSHSHGELLQHPSHPDVKHVLLIGGFGSSRYLRSVLEHHGQVHAQPNHFLCSEHGCDRVFSRRSDLWKHGRMHLSRLRPFTCSGCAERFYFHKDLRRHILAHHSDGITRSNAGLGAKNAPQSHDQNSWTGVVRAARMTGIAACDYFEPDSQPRHAFTADEKAMRAKYEDARSRPPGISIGSYSTARSFTSTGQQGWLSCARAWTELSEMHFGSFCMAVAFEVVAVLLVTIHCLFDDRSFRSPATHANTFPRQRLMNIGWTCTSTKRCNHSQIGTTEHSWIYRAFVRSAFKRDLRFGATWV